MIGQADVFQPKRSYFAASFFLKALGDYTYDQSLPMLGIKDGYLLSFAKKRDHRYAAWTISARRNRRFFPFRPANIRFMTSWELSNNITVDKSGLPLTLTGDVQFVVPGALKDTEQK